MSAVTVPSYQRGVRDRAACRCLGNHQSQLPFPVESAIGGSFTWPGDDGYQTVRGHALDGALPKNSDIESAIVAERNSIGTDGSTQLGKRQRVDPQALRRVVLPLP